MARPSGRPIRDELLVAASALIQRVGVNGFSYGVLAGELGISAPSIHHHFGTKDDLIGAVVARYRMDFADSVEAIEATGDGDPVGRIIGFAELFDVTADRASMCLCGSVASDWATVGPTARAEVHGFFADQVAWLCGRLDEAVAAGRPRPRGESEEAARLLLSALEGSMLLARAGDEKATPSIMARRLLDELSC